MNQMGGFKVFLAVEKWAPEKKKKSK